MSNFKIENPRYIQAVIAPNVESLKSSADKNQLTFQQNSKVVF